MLSDVIAHKYDILVIEGGGGRDKKVSVKGALVKRPRPMTYMEGIKTLSMVVSIVGRTCSRVVGPLGL